MAQRWTFTEDYIVCRFAFEHAYEHLKKNDVENLIRELEEHGITNRNYKAVSGRAYVYQKFFNGESDRYATEQIKTFANAYLNRREKPLKQQEAQFSIEEPHTYNEDDMYDNASLLGVNPNQLHQLVALDPIAPSFKDLLREYIRKSGMTDSEVYRASFVSRDKFNHIINGRKGQNIKDGSDNNKVNASQTTVMKLCIGLKLAYTDAVYLMSCAGYAFQPNNDVDRVVVACLRQRIYNIIEVNMELYERNLEPFIEPNW